MKSDQGNITDHLFDYSVDHPDQAAILHPDKITFSALRQRIDQYASGFLASGIKAGIKTIVLIKPGVDLFAVTFALFRIGAVPVLIDPGMGTRNMVNALYSIQCEALVGIPRAQLLKRIFPHSLRSVRIWISTRPFPGSKIKNLKSIREMGTLTNEAFHHDPEEVAAIFFTSGSTGSSKAVVYTSSMLHAQIQYMKDHFGYRPGGIDLCTFPLIGLLVISHGISIVLADMNMTRPVTMDPAKVTRNIRQYQCNSMFCSPMVMKKLGEYGIQHKITLPSLKKIYTAGAPVKPAVLNQFGQLLEPHATIHTPFGSTEALSVSDITDNELLSMYDPAGNYFHGICVGVPLKGIRLKVIQSVLDPIDKWDDKKLLSPDEVGEICVSGPNVSPLYLNNDNANKSAKIQDPANHIFWHRTGDLGRIDENQRIWYYGRKSQCVISGEQIFYTIPTEAVFNQHPGVLRSALVGVVKENNVVPAICIELKRRIRRTRALEKELLDLGQKNEITQEISILLFFRKFPVDPRHNAKIRREILAQKAQSSIG